MTSWHHDRRSTKDKIDVLTWHTGELKIRGFDGEHKKGTTACPPRMLPPLPQLKGVKISSPMFLKIIFSRLRTSVSADTLASQHCWMVGALLFMAVF